jgi:hypothetical protein
MLGCCLRGWEVELVGFVVWLKGRVGSKAGVVGAAAPATRVCIAWMRVRVRHRTQGSLGWPPIAYHAQSNSQYPLAAVVHTVLSTTLWITPKPSNSPVPIRCGATADTCTSLVLFCSSFGITATKNLNLFKHGPLGLFYFIYALRSFSRHDVNT